jgi:hypothetical protein
MEREITKKKEKVGSFYREFGLCFMRDGISVSLETGPIFISTALV